MQSLAASWSTQKWDVAQTDKRVGTPEICPITSLVNKCKYSNSAKCRDKDPGLQDLADFSKEEMSDA